MKQKAFEFQTIYNALQLELAATKMRCAEVVVKARRTREHVQHCRARRNCSAWAPQPEPIVVSERSGHVH